VGNVRYSEGAEGVLGELENVATVLLTILEGTEMQSKVLDLAWKVDEYSVQSLSSPL